MSDKRDIFSARLRHELTQETHVVVGDHQPEPRRIGKHPAPYGERLGALHNAEMTPRHAVNCSFTAGAHEYKTGRFEPRDVAERQLDLYSFALTGGPRVPDEELAAIDGAAHHPLGDAERERVVNQLTEAPVDSPVCKCHDRMGND